MATRIIPLLLILVVAGCSITSIHPIAEALPGSWKQQISILGEQRESIITFNIDGTFIEVVGRETRAGFFAFPALHGKWSSEGEIITLEYQTGFTGTGHPATERRRVIKLTENSFISADNQFSIIVERNRQTSADTK